MFLIWWRARQTKSQLVERQDRKGIARTRTERMATSLSTGNVSLSELSKGGDVTGARGDRGKG